MCTAYKHTIFLSNKTIEVVNTTLIEGLEKLPLIFYRRVKENKYLKI